MANSEGPLWQRKGAFKKKRVKHLHLKFSKQLRMFSFPPFPKKEKPKEHKNKKEPHLRVFINMSGQFFR